MARRPKPNLRLVHSIPGSKGRKEYKRPLKVCYYASEDTLPDYPDSWGFPESHKGVIKGAMARIWEGEFAVARIYDTRTGLMDMSIHAMPNGQLPEPRYGGKRLGRLTPSGKIKYG